MTFVYCKFFTYADAYNINLTTDTWAQIPLCIKYRNKCDFDDANKVRTTISWHEYVGTSSNTELHTYVSNWAITPGQQDFTTEEYVSESEFTNPNRVVTNTAKIRFEWMRNSTVLSSDEINFNIYGKAGGVSWAYPMPQPYQSTYPLTGDLFSIGSIMTDYSSTSSGAPIVWREPYNGIAKDGWACGLIYSYSHGRYYTFDEAISAGIIKSASCDSYVNDDRSGSKRINGIFIAMLTGYEGFVSPGMYQVGIRYYDQSRSASQGSYTARNIMGNTFTVYEPFAGAALYISSISPAKYAYGSSDPLRGIPPYTVTVYDNTYARRNTYTVPVTSITIDWGDPSNPGNIWTYNNPGTSYISIPSHQYTDTGSHTITMTCVDALGNTTTASVNFTPSTDPRIITRPLLNNQLGGATIQMNYPALMQGVAENAGNPMPTVTWTYSLQNDPGYYSGSKTGEYTEFSLLAQGRYTVTAVVKNGSSTLGSYSWTVTVGAESVATEAFRKMQDYALIVLSSSDMPVDYCKVHTCPQYTENFQDLDTVSFELPADYEYARYLKEGSLFLFGYGGYARQMQVTYRNIKDGVMTVSGESTFPKRVAVYATRSLSDGGYDVQKCSAEALIRYFVYTSRQPDPYSGVYRGANITMHGTNQDRPTGGEQVTYSARFDNVLDIINSICKTAGIGYWIGVRETSSGSIDALQIEIVQGTNRTYSSGGANAVIFSEKLKNCIIESDQSALTSNIAVTAGAGVGYIRDHSYYDINGNLNQTNITGFGRREVFVDAGDSADAAEQKRMAMYELREEQALSISLQVLPTCQWKYGTDYNVGDTVSVWLDSRGGLVDLQIYSADHVQRESGEELHLRLGSRAQTAPALIASNERKNTYARK